MSLNEYQKYGFNIEWFLDVYDKPIEKHFHTDIDLKCKEHYLNYSNFLKSVSILLNIPEEDFGKYKEKEKKCIDCKKKYPFCMDSFIYIYNSENKEITESICYDCIQNIKKCTRCNEPLNEEPYLQIIKKEQGYFCYNC